MRICVFADIHGNWPAFEAASPLILAEKADLNICLGDVCGYYREAAKVLAELRAFPKLKLLRGNHDDMFLRAAAGDGGLRRMYAAKYGPALEDFLGGSHEHEARWLSQAAAEYQDPALDLRCSHGGPNDPLEEYVYPSDPMERFAGIAGGWYLLGHTHYAMDRAHGSLRAVNPGSLGQPRDGNWPRFAVIDTVAARTEFREVRFDKDRFAADTRAWDGSHPYLWEVWNRITT